MPKTISNFTGDGLADPIIQVNIQVPDSGASVLVAGTVRAPGATNVVTVTGSPLTAPGVPGSGITSWIIQADLTTGALSIKTSSSAMPAADAGALMIFSDTIASTDSGNMALNASDQTPDTY